jgi:hypothetical protein
LKRRAPALLFAWLLGASLSLSACRRHESGPPRGTASPPASAASAGAVASASSSAESPPAGSATAPTALPNGCRVLAVKGSKPGAAPPPSVGTRLTGLGWFELADGVELALKHGDTLRELSLLGPGRFLACPAGDETVLVASGSVATSAGAGARAGAVVTLATPFGVIEYPDAELRLEVAAGKLSLAVKHGQATLVASAKRGAAAPKPETVRAPAGRAELRGTVNTSELVARCDERRAAARSPVSAPSDAGARARWAVARMQAHRDARLACEVAHAATGRLAEPERRDFEAQLRGRAASERGEVTTSPAGGNPR